MKQEKKKKKPTWNYCETVMRQRSWCVCWVNRSKAHVQIVVRRGYWRSLMRVGRGELSHQRAQGFLFFFFKHSVRTGGQNGRLILKENMTRHQQRSRSAATEHWFMFYSCHWCVRRIELALNGKYKRRVLEEMRLPSCNYNNPQWTSFKSINL